MSYFVGGYHTNAVTFQFNHKLHIQYIRSQDAATEPKKGDLCSLISFTVYPGFDHSTIEAIPNPYDEIQQKGTIMIVVFGLGREDTLVAVNTLGAIIEGKEEPKMPAVIIHKEGEKSNFVM